MAAIKRSQSIQRRHPDSSSSVSAVRVDLRHLTLSVLDDPVISRVFSDAGFRSSDIKYAILRPNLADEAEGSRRRIGEILVAGRGPVLVGARAADSARDFASCVERRVWESLPPAIEGRVWLMGHVASYETYMKFLSRFPSVNKDWDLQLLPITSLRLHRPCPLFCLKFLTIPTHHTSQCFFLHTNSLTEPFVPSGGFSETASEMKSSLISTHHSLFRCFLCNEKYEEEASALLKGYTSIANQNYISYPSHIQGVEAINTCNGLDVDKVKEDAAILNAKVLSLQKKWNDICLHFHRDSSDFKELCRSLMGKVGRQDEAICTISQTVVRCRTGKERCLGASMKGVIWFGFLGPDRVGKRRIATALAELIFGSKYNFICVDLNLQGLAPPKFRGKTIVDYIASEISRQPLSVVFLENVDKADLLVQNSLYQAIKTGKISDSYGREISINNAMFITTAREIKSNASLTRTECVNFSEERILEAEEWQMQILVGSGSETRCSSANVILTSKTDFVNAQGSISSSFSNKRKLNVDETVVFSPFDFDAIANKILMQISELFRSDFGSQALLEIDSKVMDHILAATWLSDDTEATDKWVKQVLGSSFSDARQRYDISANTVMKLVHSEDTFMEEQAIGIHLPARITLN
ncbi:hypothetical protein QJS04_geneDACA010584 [Acorus gramineus]|uniref:ATPase AAA-type core domain-containing protein n=1 Tax=Acorus gramineus TaxID=55184 RepID=A0AAV9AKY1_ACOGR|nr:hypothetical protein QJS04_geneDACA010584 [Acorus gramineus]